MNEQIANKIVSKGEYKPVLSGQDTLMITQALAAVVAAQPDNEQSDSYKDLIARLLGDAELADELVDVTVEQLQQFTEMLEQQPTEVGQKAFNYKHQRWDEPFDLEAVSDEVAKEYIPQDEFTLRTYDRTRKRNKSKHEALTAALQPHLEQE